MRYSSGVYFAACVGDEQLGRELGLVGARHGARIGLRAFEATRALGRGDRLTCVWLAPAGVDVAGLVAEGAKGIIFGTAPGPTPDGRARAAEARSNSAGLEVSAEGEVALYVPLTSAEAFFHCRRGGGVALSNDLRWLSRLLDVPRVDPRSAHALLAISALTGELGFFQGVRRIPPGHSLRLSGREGARIERTLPPLRDFLPAAVSRPDDVVRDALDAVLERTPARALLLFSGGVDSSLAAARLAALGRTDVPLVHFTFGEQDAETPVARRIAQHLRMPFETVAYDPGDVAAMLGRVGADYSHPFGDFSAIPTNGLAHAALVAHEGSAVLECTGADGEFVVGAGYSRWASIARIPRAVRRLVAHGLELTRPWFRQDRAETAWRALRRSEILSIPLAAVAAQHALAGRAFDLTPSELRSIEQEVASRTLVFADGMEQQDRLALLDLVHVCAGEFAAKSFDVLRALGGDPRYPFLEPPMVRAAFSLPFGARSEPGEPKAVLKRLLAERVPRELVYRAKSGFRPPLERMLTRQDVRPVLRDVLEPSLNPLLAFASLPFLAQLVERASSGLSLSYASLCHLWVHVFTTQWARPLSEPLPPAAPPRPILATPGADGGRPARSS